MSCVLSICTAIVTILLLSTLPIEIGCCGLTTNEIISLMHQNPDYKQDPCYIEWKDSQDEKLTQLWTRRAELEKSMAEYNRKRSEYDRQERENRQRSYLSTSKVEVKLVKMYKSLTVATMTLRYFIGKRHHCGKCLELLLVS